MTERYRLVGDEDTGVGLQCDDCWDGGRPIAYYAGIRAAYEDDPAVENVSSIEALLAVRDRHEREQHGAPVRMTEEVGRADG